MIQFVCKLCRQFDRMCFSFKLRTLPFGGIMWHPSLLELDAFDPTKQLDQFGQFGPEHGIRSDPRERDGKMPSIVKH